MTSVAASALMYYPMRVVLDGRYKLIWNLTHDLPYPFASDLWEASTWQDRFQQGPETLYGKRTVEQYIHRPEFELFDLEADPHEIDNLATKPAHAELLSQLKTKLQQFQRRTGDPWELKWRYE
jgi:N-sulfoglucosamine sulfohydrolase